MCFLMIVYHKSSSIEYVIASPYIFVKYVCQYFPASCELRLLCISSIAARGVCPPESVGMKPAP